MIKKTIFQTQIIVFFSILGLFYSLFQLMAFWNNTRLMWISKRNTKSHRCVYNRYADVTSFSITLFRQTDPSAEFQFPVAIFYCNFVAWISKDSKLTFFSLFFSYWVILIKNLQANSLLKVIKFSKFWPKKF